MLLDPHLFQGKPPCYPDQQSVSEKTTIFDSNIRELTSPTFPLLCQHYYIAVLFAPYVPSFLPLLSLSSSPIPHLLIFKHGAFSFVDGYSTYRRHHTEP